MLGLLESCKSPAETKQRPASKSLIIIISEPPLSVAAGICGPASGQHGNGLNDLRASERESLSRAGQEAAASLADNWRRSRASQELANFWRCCKFK